MLIWIDIIWYLLDKHYSWYSFWTSGNELIFMKQSDWFYVFLGLHSTQLHKKDRRQEVPNQSSVFSRFIFLLYTTTSVLQMCTHNREYPFFMALYYPALLLRWDLFLICLSLSLIHPQALYSGHGLSKTVVPPADLHTVTRVSPSGDPLLFGIMFYCVRSCQRTKCAFILNSKSTFLWFTCKRHLTPQVSAGAMGGSERKCCCCSMWRASCRYLHTGVDTKILALWTIVNFLRSIQKFCVCCSVGFSVMQEIWISEPQVTPVCFAAFSWILVCIKAQPALEMLNCILLSIKWAGKEILGQIK